MQKLNRKSPIPVDPVEPQYHRPFCFRIRYNTMSRFATTSTSNRFADLDFDLESTATSKPVAQRVPISRVVQPVHPARPARVVRPAHRKPNAIATAIAKSISAPTRVKWSVPAPVRNERIKDTVPAPPVHDNTVFPTLSTAATSAPVYGVWNRGDTIRTMYNAIQIAQERKRQRQELLNQLALQRQHELQLEMADQRQTRSLTLRKQDFYDDRAHYHHDHHDDEETPVDNDGWITVDRSRKRSTVYIPPDMRYGYEEQAEEITDVYAAEDKHRSIW